LAEPGLPRRRGKETDEEDVQEAVYTQTTFTGRGNRPHVPSQLQYPYNWVNKYQAASSASLEILPLPAPLPVDIQEAGGKQRRSRGGLSVSSGLDQWAHRHPPGFLEPHPSTALAPLTPFHTTNVTSNPNRTTRLDLPPRAQDSNNTHNLATVPGLPQISRGGMNSPTSGFSGATKDASMLTPRFSRELDLSPQGAASPNPIGFSPETKTPATRKRRAHSNNLYAPAPSKPLEAEAHTSTLKPAPSEPNAVGLHSTNTSQQSHVPSAPSFNNSEQSTSASGCASTGHDCPPGRASSVERGTSSELGSPVLDPSSHNPYLGCFGLQPNFRASRIHQNPDSLYSCGSLGSLYPDAAAMFQNLFDEAVGIRHHSTANSILPPRARVGPTTPNGLSLSARDQVSLEPLVAHGLPLSAPGQVDHSDHNGEWIVTGDCHTSGTAETYSRAEKSAAKRHGHPEAETASQAGNGPENTALDSFLTNIPTQAGSSAEKMTRDDAPISREDLFWDFITYRIPQMMYVSGETGEPSVETTGIIEDIVRQQVVEIVSSAVVVIRALGLTLATSFEAALSWLHAVDLGQSLSMT